ncbi:MAG: hypothetical protein AB1445_01695 [Bacillota bacterium]
MMRILEFANGRGMAVAQTVTEIGSGLDGHRPQLLNLLADQQVTTMVVEHREPNPV